MFVCPVTIDTAGYDSQKKEHRKFRGCAPGFGFDDGHCRPCRSGWFAPGGLTKCLPCGHERTNEGFVTPKGAHSASQCLCAAGYGGFSCDECEAGTFSLGGNIGDRETARPPCQVCPANSKNSHEKGATSLLACGGCNPGYGGFNCDKCAPGTYSEGKRRCSAAATHNSPVPLTWLVALKELVGRLYLETQCGL